MSKLGTHIPKVGITIECLANSHLIVSPLCCKKELRKLAICCESQTNELGCSKELSDLKECYEIVRKIIGNIK